MKKTLALCVFALSVGVGVGARAAFRLECFNDDGLSTITLGKNAGGTAIDAEAFAHCGPIGTSCTYKIRLTIKDSNGNNIQGSPQTQGYTDPCGATRTNTLSRNPGNGTWKCTAELLDGNGANVIKTVGPNFITLP